MSAIHNTAIIAPMLIIKYVAMSFSLTKVDILFLKRYIVDPIIPRIKATNPLLLYSLFGFFSTAYVDY